MSKKMRTTVVAVVACGIAALMLLPLSTAQEKAKGQSTKRDGGTAMSSGPSKTATPAPQNAKPAAGKAAIAKSATSDTANDEAPAKSIKVDKTSKSSKTAAESPKASGNTLRLPKHFSGIVDQAQREAIYAIQLEYRSKIAEIEEELARVRQDELSALEELLTDSQRKLLVKKRSQAQDSAKAKMADAESESADRAQ
jgi:hypothetical protein